MNRYLCQLCYTIVTYGEKHPCFFYKDDGYVYSLPEQRDKENPRIDEAIQNGPENLRDNFENVRGVAQQDNTEESHKLSRRLAESDARYGCSSHSTISCPLESVPSFSRHSKESKDTNLWNSCQGFEPVCTSQDKIRGASRRKSKPRKIFYGKSEEKDCELISFHQESTVNCRTPQNKSSGNVSINGMSRSSTNTKSHDRGGHSNSQNIFEASNLIPCVSLPQGIARTNQALTEDSHNVTDVPVSPEGASLVQYSSGFSITNGKLFHDSMENANSIAGSSGTNRDPAKKRFPSDLSNKSFDRKNSLSNHYRTGGKSFVCNVCQKVFAKEGHLTQHYRTHTGERPFVCDVCQKLFSEKGNLNKHYRIHTGEKPFVCDVCRKGFSEKGKLNNHYRIHTGEKPFVCDVCQKGFSQKGNLNKHYRIHTGEKPFVCDVCQKGFSQECNLNQYYRIHTGEKPFVCNVCIKDLSLKTNLNTYYRTHRNDIPFV